jgi:hypothetical protein
MKYKNLNLAFLYEIIVGFGCIMSVAIWGQNGLATLGLIAIRPIVLEKEQIKDEKSYFTLSYKVLSSSIVIVAMLIIAIFIIINFIPHLIPKLPPRDKILFLLIPFFLMTHGVVGFMYNQKQ